MTNILLKTDTYNISHYYMRDIHGKDIAYIYNRNAPIILFGLAGRINFLMKHTVSDYQVQELVNIAKTNGIKNPPEEMLYKFVQDHRGLLDNVLDIKMLPEFTWIPKGTPFCKISNKVEGFEELVTWWEGFLTKAYFPSVIATRLYQYKEAGLKNIHNFGYRSSSSDSNSWLSDLIFLFFYNGTDSFAINELVEMSKRGEYPYNESLYKYSPYRNLIAKLKPQSIAAASHKVIQSFIKERNAYHWIIREYSGDTVAFPIDTYNPIYFIENILPECLEWACQFNTNTFFRIDSGDLLEQAKSIIKKIVDFKKEKAVANVDTIPKFGVIIGDNMDLENVKSIRNEINKLCMYLTGYYFLDNVINVDEYLYFGVGSSIINNITRDSVGWVTKLGWSTNLGNTMKISYGNKESLLGDLAIEYDSGSGSYIVSESSRETQNTDIYMDWKDTVQEYNFDDMIKGNLLKPNLQISPQVQENIRKFKSKFLH